MSSAKNARRFNLDYGASARDELSDVAEIERQHADMLMFFEISMDAAQHSDPDAFRALAREFRSSLVQHYAMEERTMEHWSIDADHVVRHKSEHAFFLQFIDQVLVVLGTKPGLEACSDMAAPLIRTMFRNHIVGMDAELAKLLAKASDPCRRKPRLQAQPGVTTKLSMAAFHVTRAQVMLELETLRRKDAEDAIQRSQTTSNLLSRILGSAQD